MSYWTSIRQVEETTFSILYAPQTFPSIDAFLSGVSMVQNMARFKTL
jgi:hypothetical protein